MRYSTLFHNLRRKARHTIIWRSLQTSPPQNGTPKHTCEDVMDIAANKATRFIYLRTLPLVKHPEISDKVKTLVGSIETDVRKICNKHIDTIIDDRAAVHLHNCALAIATHRVLSPYIKNQIRLNNIIRAGFGAMPISDPALSDEANRAAKSVVKLRPDYWISRFALLFSWDKMAAVRKMTANMAADFGATFETHTPEVSNTESQRPEHRLIVTKCYYDRICREEGLAHLTRIFCALDRALFVPISEKSHGVTFSLDSTLAPDEDTKEAGQNCQFTFKKHI